MCRRELPYVRPRFRCSETWPHSEMVLRKNRSSNRSTQIWSPCCCIWTIRKTKSNRFVLLDSIRYALCIKQIGLIAMASLTRGPNQVINPEAETLTPLWPLPSLQCFEHNKSSGGDVHMKYATEIGRFGLVCLQVYFLVRAFFSNDSGSLSLSDAVLSSKWLLNAVFSILVVVILKGLAVALCLILREVGFTNLHKVPFLKLFFNLPLQYYCCCWFLYIVLSQKVLKEHSMCQLCYIYVFTIYLFLLGLGND